MEEIAACLKLQQSGPVNVTEWTNLDGSSLTTYEYRSHSGRGNVFLAPYAMPYPEYIRRNMSLLEQPMRDCPAEADYIQGCRFYSHEGLHLAIATRYDYMLKIDLDVEFNATLPFHVLYDMELKGAVVGHTAAFPNGFQACTKGYHKVVESFTEEYGGKARSDNAPAWVRSSNWQKPCSAGTIAFDRFQDQFYTNLLIYRTDFFQSPEVLAFARWMNEFTPGYFAYRWTDQLFFHHAMGMFLGPNFMDYVADYTDLRCFRYPNCWFFWAGTGRNESKFCQTGGYFLHGKHHGFFGDFDWNHFDRTPSPYIDEPFLNTYQHDCSAAQKDVAKKL